MQNLAQMPVPRQHAPFSSVLVEHYRDAAHCIAWSGNVQMIVSLEPPTNEVMQKIIGGLDALSARCRCGTGSLVVINSDCPPPSDEARRYIKAELARSSMVAAAQVVEGTGFRGAAMRAVLSMLQLASRASYPMSVFSGVPEGAAWLCTELNKRIGRAPEAGDVVSAVNECRRRLTAG